MVWHLCIVSPKTLIHHRNFRWHLVHAFPPDIGQGVNAGLGDVLSLRQALSRITAGTSIGKALKEYEQNRCPEVMMTMDLKCRYPFFLLVTFLFAYQNR